jgi:hypothetical protein
VTAAASKVSRELGDLFGASRRQRRLPGFTITESSYAYGH